MTSAARTRKRLAGGRAAPAPPAPGAAYATIEGVAGLLTVSRRRVGELRANDPSFPAGRLFGGAGALRFSIAAVLEWAAKQPEARFSAIGADRRFPSSANEASLR